MERDQIEAFLSIVHNGTISAAANNLYSTQSSISKRISLLEEEIGVPLFVRGKGIRRVELTSYGESFLSIARKWEALNKEFEAIRFTNVIHEISIGATDLVNRITLKGLYQNILSQYPNFRLDLHTHHSKQIYQMMESNSLDLGYVNLLLPVSNISIKKIMDEEFVVLIHAEKEIPSVISYKDLDPSREVFSRWNDEFEIWHEQYWPHRMYRIRVGTGSMIADYLREEGRWAIVPITCVRELMIQEKLQYSRLDIKTPKRSLYLLQNKNPRQSRMESVTLVKSVVEEYLKEKVLL